MTRASSLFFLTILVILALCLNVQAKKDPAEEDAMKDKDLGALYRTRKARAAVQKALVERLYNRIIWPTSSLVAQQIEANIYTPVEDLMLANVTGRINPLGRFDTYFLTGEYFFSLAGPLPGQSTVGRNRVTEISFTVPIQCWENACWYRVLIIFRRFSDNFNVQNYTQTGVVYFDSSDRICSYEINFIGLERTLNLPENNAVRQATYAGLCSKIVSSCTGPNIQYDGNATTCLNFFNSIPYGGWGVADQNTVACRILHSSLVNGNPAVHCPHVGATGGDKCIFHDAASYYNDGLGNCADPNW